MAAQAVAARSRSRRRVREPEPARGPLAWVLGIPVWLRVVLALGIVLLVFGGGAWLYYRALDELYPQEIWKYFRPAPPAPSGRLLYRDLDGQLFIAPLTDLQGAKRLLDPAAAAGGREFVRDAVYLPERKLVAYFATVRQAAGEHDHLKVVDLDGRLTHDVDISEASGELVRPAVFASASGRYVAVTNRERTRAYFYDLTGGGALSALPFESPPERMLWTRNADLIQAPQPGQAAIAASGDGKLRAQVRAGKRRAPECDDPKCETAQELVVSSGTVAGSQNPPTVLYGVFSSFSAEGWGPVPTQPAQRLYGRLVWAPDGKHLLFSTLDGANANTYAIGTDGKTQPRLVLEAAEALDWLP
jgi:hypothetical protein